MRKIIAIFVLFLIALVFSQPALAGPKESCVKCCDGLEATYQTACDTACGKYDSYTTPSDRMTNCQASCDSNIKDDSATDKDDIARAGCKSCCASLGYAYGSPITSYTQIATLISTATRWFQGIVMAIAIIMIIYGGVLYITAGGSEEKAKTARRLLMYALIGIAIVLLAWGAEFLVLSFLTP